ncbi:MAG: hypothetical protein WCI17_03820 [bacterium]
MRFLSRMPWLLLLLLLVAAAWSIRPISDTDILWHLRAGQWMLAHGAVIRHDVFSATRLGCDWVSVPWLYQVMLARLHAALGWGGLTLWQVLMVLAITLQTALLAWLLRRSHAGGALPHRWNWNWPYLSIPAALAVLLMLRLLQMRINCRPELFTYLFIGSFLILLSLFDAKASHVTAERSNTRHPPPSTLLLWLLPLLQILWTNTHGAFILGPVIVWAYAGGAWLAYLAACAAAPRSGARQESGQGEAADGSVPVTGAELPLNLRCRGSQSRATGERARSVAGGAGGIAQPVAGAAPVRLTVVAVLTTLACLATPYGLAGTFYPFHLFHVLTDPLYKNGIVEGQPVDLSTVLDSGSLGYAFLACWVFAGLGLLGRVMEGVRCPVSGVRASCSGFHILHAACRMPHAAPGYLLTCAAMAYLSLAAVRNVPLLALVAAPLMASGLEYAADGLAALVARIGGLRIANRRLRIVEDPERSRTADSPMGSHAEAQPGGSALPGSAGVFWLHSRGVHIVAQALLALGLLFLYRAIVSERFYASLGWRMRFAIGFSDHEHPLAACDFVERHRPEISCRTLYGDTRSANLFLARFGPDWPVYFDGRHAEIYDAPTFRTAARTRWDPALFTREAGAYGIGLACFSLTDLKEDRSPLAIALGQTNSWRLVYLDDCAAMFAAVTPDSTAFVRSFGLPCAPTNAALQRLVFAGWLARQGRSNLAALHDPANRVLEEGVLAGSLVNAMQLSGLWAPARRLEPIRFCRLASFVDQLGWTVVADDLYQQTLRWPESFRIMLPRAIRQAQKLSRSLEDPALKAEMQNRVLTRARELQRADPGNAVAAEVLGAR